jgi:hypothetical protein
VEPPAIPGAVKRPRAPPRRANGDPHPKFDWKTGDNSPTPSLLSREREGRAIPDVLLSGDHAKIAEWRRAEAERIIHERRPGLTDP